jgi:hypothetical protein
MALYAIRERAIEAHKIWMIRAYVVTFGFVTFRLVEIWLPAFAAREVTAIWLSWVVPLFVTILVQSFISLRQSAA